MLMGTDWYENREGKICADVEPRICVTQDFESVSGPACAFGRRVPEDTEICALQHNCEEAPYCIDSHENCSTLAVDGRMDRLYLVLPMIVMMSRL